MNTLRLLLTTTLLSMLLNTAQAMPPEQIKQVLNMTQSSWATFRDFDGRQLIYFTHLESYACGIQAVRYINPAI